jgi:hypothetical protein
MREREMERKKRREEKDIKQREKDIEILRERDI